MPKESADHPFEKGKSYFIRAVTYHQIGEVVGTCGNFLCLRNAAWVANSGPFEQALLDGVLDDVEFVGTAFVALSAIVDAFPWPHKLPVLQRK